MGKKWKNVFEVTAEKNGLKKVKNGKKMVKKVDFEGKSTGFGMVWCHWKGNFWCPGAWNGEKWWKKPKMVKNTKKNVVGNGLKVWENGEIGKKKEENVV